MKYLLPSFMIFWAIAGIAGASPQLLDVDRGEDFYRLGHYLEILEDPSGALSFKEAQSATTWRASRQSQHAFGQTESTFWLRFTVLESKQPRNMMLVTRKGFINETDYFVQKSDGSYHKIEIRNSRMSESNGVGYRFPVITIPIQSQERTHYIRLRRTIALHATLDLWEPRAFLNFALTELFLMGGFYGTVFVMVLYNFLIYLNLREPYYLLYIGYVAALGLFQAWYDEVLFQYTSIRESNPLPSLVMGHACLWFSLFARSFLRLSELKWTRHLSNIMLLISATIMASPFIMSDRGQYFFTLSGVVFIAGLGLALGLTKIVIGYRPSRYFVLAMISPGLAIIFVTMRTLVDIVPGEMITYYALPAGTTAQLILFAFALSHRIRLEQKETQEAVENLNRNLDEKVQERTAEIQSLLRFIPQGVLSIGNEGYVTPNFSAQLPQILGTETIAKQSFKDLFLNHCHLSDDDKDQAWQTILASVGGSYLNFECNQEKLPRSVTYHSNNRFLTLQLTWNMELDQNEEVQHLLVTMLDITEESRAKEQLTKKNQDFEVIQQLVEAGPKRASQFFASGQILIDENLRLVRSGHVDPDTLKIIFVNLHTLKGAARTLKFKNLSDRFHTLETHYSEILKKQLNPDQVALEADMKEAEDLFHRYLKINRDTLGRGEDLSKVTIDRRFLEDSFRLLRFIETGVVLPDSLRDIIRENSEQLTNHIFMSLASMLQDLAGQAEKIAKDLGKAPPRISIQTDDIFITHDQDVLLRNCLIHILRNSLDHGIENRVQRLDAGKPEAGAIYIEAIEKSGTITIQLHDDGRGLNIAALRERGLQRGMIHGGSTADEIADLIFSHGFSTAQKVSQISGRGVGMNAVRQYLEQSRGHVSLKLEPSRNDTQEYYHFSIILSLPAQFIDLTALQNCVS